MLKDENKTEDRGLTRKETSRSDVRVCVFRAPLPPRHTLASPTLHSAAAFSCSREGVGAERVCVSEDVRERGERGAREGEMKHARQMRPIILHEIRQLTLRMSKIRLARSLHCWLTSCACTSPIKLLLMSRSSEMRPSSVFGNFGTDGENW